MIVLERPAALPFRWFGRGVDLRAIANGDRPLFLARDVCDLLEIDVEYSADAWGVITWRWPGNIITLPGLVEEDGEPTGLYDVVAVQSVARDNPSYLTADFLEFFRTVVDELLRDELPDPQSHLDGGSLLQETFSVAEAAKILTRDPALAYGRDSLFQTMRNRMLWIEREVDVWVPRPEPLRCGYLVRQKVVIRPGWAKQVYPQIRVTRAGLQELHRRLGGVATLQLDARPHPELVEL